MFYERVIRNYNEHVHDNTNYVFHYDIMLNITSYISLEGN